MSHAAYKWQGQLFCNGCIVAVMSDSIPAVEHVECEAGRHEQQLDEMATVLHVDRTTSDDSFPQRVTELPDGLCRYCLLWFK